LVIGVASLVATQAPWWPRFTLGACFTIAIAAGIVVGKNRSLTIAVLVVTVPLALFAIASSEEHGGNPFWNDVVEPEELALLDQAGLSVFTPPYLPLVFDEASTVFVIDYAPGFPAGLWGSDWKINVSHHEIDLLASDLEPAECPEAILVEEDNLADVESWLMAADARVRNLVRWNDQRVPVAWLTGIRCPTT
jgi:hypothetical protein